MAGSASDAKREAVPTKEPHPLLLHSLLLGERLYLFARLRLLAAVFILVGAVFADTVVGIQGLSVAGLAACSAFLAVYGAAALRAIRPYRRPEQAQPSQIHLVRIAHTTISLDYIVLTCVIGLVGGAQSPFLAFYLIHAIVASVLLSRRAAFAHALVGYLLLTGLVVGEWTGVLPKHRPVGAVFGGPELDARVVLTILFVYGLLTGVATFLMTGIARLLRDGEGRLREASEDLDRLANLRRAFLHVVLHDLRGPVGTVVTLLDNLQAGLGGPLTDTQAQWVGRADARLRSMLELLRDLQTLADLETGSIEKMMGDVDVVALVCKAVEEHLEGAQEHDISLAADLPPLVITVRGVERLLGEAITNYLTNAIKYTQRGGHVTARVRTDDGRVRIEVVDDGPGIARADQARLFREFARVARRSGAKAVPGTGLGLSIARRIAEAHGGRAGVESELGKGSTFFLELASVAPSRLEPMPPPSPRPVSGCSHP
jgi:signal transduction histidine kinase